MACGCTRWVAIALASVLVAKRATMSALITGFGVAAPIAVSGISRVD